MDRVTIISSDVSSVQYDENNSLMEVEFIKNGPYVYYNVPATIYADFLAADSKGRFVYKVLRQGPFPYNKGTLAEARDVAGYPMELTEADIQFE